MESNNNSSKISFYEDLPKINIKYLVQDQVQICRDCYLNISDDGDIADEQKYERAVNMLWDYVDDFADSKSRKHLIDLNKRNRQRLEKAENIRDRANIKTEHTRQKFKVIMRLLRRLNWI
jgi:hypothetical protein